MRMPLPVAIVVVPPVPIPFTRSMSGVRRTWIGGKTTRIEPRVEEQPAAAQPLDRAPIEATRSEEPAGLQHGHVELALELPGDGRASGAAPDDDRPRPHGAPPALNGRAHTQSRPRVIRSVNESRATGEAAIRPASSDDIRRQTGGEYQLANAHRIDRLAAARAAEVDPDRPVDDPGRRQAVLRRTRARRRSRARRPSRSASRNMRSSSDEIRPGPHRLLGPRCVSTRWRRPGAPAVQPTVSGGSRPNALAVAAIRARRAARRTNAGTCSAGAAAAAFTRSLPPEGRHRRGTRVARRHVLVQGVHLPGEPTENDRPPELQVRRSARRSRPTSRP